LTLLDEGERSRVQTVALAGGARPVVEHMPQMRTAARTVDLRAHHAEGSVLMFGDVLGIELAIKARPSGSGIEFVLARKKRKPTHDARIDPVFLVVEKHSAKWSLGGRALRDAKRFGVELLGQLGDAIFGKRRNVVIRLRNFGWHGDSYCLTFKG
jgi:hypothetical protein